MSNSDFLVIEAFNISKKYDYQQTLSKSHCPTCHAQLKWQIATQKDDDRFCTAMCCGIKYLMIPEVVRICTYTNDEKQIEAPFSITDETTFGFWDSCDVKQQALTNRFKKAEADEFMNELNELARRNWQKSGTLHDPPSVVQ